MKGAYKGHRAVTLQPKSSPAPSDAGNTTEEEKTKTDLKNERKNVKANARAANGTWGAKRNGSEEVKNEEEAKHPQSDSSLSSVPSLSEHSENGNHSDADVASLDEDIEPNEPAEPANSTKPADTASTDSLTNGVSKGQKRGSEAVAEGDEGRATKMVKLEDAAEEKNLEV